jgi:hypothetical protein
MPERPCSNFGDLAVRLHNNMYYCHPKYTKLHRDADEICDKYIQWKDSREIASVEAQLSLLLETLIDGWVKMFDSVSLKNIHEEVEIGDICAICCETPESRSSVKRCSNGHIFHEQCVIDLTIHSKEQKYNAVITCPTCRTIMDFEYTKDIRAI